MKLLLKLILVGLATFSVLVGLRTLGQMIHPGATHYWIKGIPQSSENPYSTNQVIDTFETYSLGILGDRIEPSGTNINGGTNWFTNATILYWGPTNYQLAFEDFETNSIGTVYTADMTNGVGWRSNGVLILYSVITPPWQPLLLNYTFSAGSGTNLIDSSTNNNGGYVVGATWVTGVNGSNYGVHFNGSSDYGRSSNNITFGTNKITVCGWLNWDTFNNLNGYAWLSSVDDNVNDDCFGLNPNWGGPGSVALAEVQSGSAGSKYQAESFARWAVSNWVHVAIIYDNSTTAGDVKVYTNGVPVTTTVITGDKDQSGNFSTNPVFLFSAGGTKWYGPGAIDDFRIYKGALNLFEIWGVTNTIQ